MINGLIAATRRILHDPQQRTDERVMLCYLGREEGAGGRRMDGWMADGRERERVLALAPLTRSFFLPP